MEYKDALVKTADAYNMEPEEIQELLIKESDWKETFQNVSNQLNQAADNLHKTTPGNLSTTKVTDTLGKNINKGIDKTKGVLKNYYGEEPKGPAKEVAQISNKDKLDKLINKVPGGGKGLAAGTGLGLAGLYGAKKLRDRNKKEEN